VAITVERLILNTPLSDAEQQGLIREWTHATDERKTEIEDYCVQQIASWWRESWKKDEEWGVIRSLNQPSATTYC